MDKYSDTLLVASRAMDDCLCKEFSHDEREFLTDMALKVDNNERLTQDEIERVIKISHRYNSK